MVKDACLVHLGGIGRDPRSLGVGILMWGTQAHNQQNAANLVYMTK
jgi:hypothetical protein